MSTDALIHDLAAGLRPVRRRNVAREALLLVALAGSEALLIAALGLVRPDMGRMIGSAAMSWKMGSLALLAGAACLVAVRSFSPPETPRRGLRLLAGALGAVAIAGALVASGAAGREPIAARIAPTHGVLCAVSIVALATPWLALLGAMMRRAAPVRPGPSALAAGLAAGTGGALVFTLCCPMDDPLYILVWYVAGCAAVAALGRWLLPRRYRL